MTLDIEQPHRLIQYLRANGHIAHNETPRITALPGGVSNRTVLVERESGETWVIKQALEKLRVPGDWFSDPARIHREAEGLRWLAKLAPAGAVPDFIFEDHETHLLCMAAVPQPHANWKTMLLEGQLRREHITQFAELLATIHRRAQEKEAIVASAFADKSFFESLRLEPYYAYTATQVPDAADFLHALIADTRACAVTLVHGDYSPKNILVHNGRLILLDHEVIHFGDPAFDIGFSMTHLLSKAHHIASMRDDFAGATRRYWQTYRQGNYAMATPAMEARAVRHTLGCLLARVAGRSPLEYLNSEARNRQRNAVVGLMPQPPKTIPVLIDAFTERL